MAFSTFDGLKSVLGSVCSGIVVVWEFLRAYRKHSLASIYLLKMTRDLTQLKRRLRNKLTPFDY